jgi:hypothetical protein
MFETVLAAVLTKVALLLVDAAARWIGRQGVAPA